MTTDKAQEANEVSAKDVTASPPSAPFFVRILQPPAQSTKEMCTRGISYITRNENDYDDEEKGGGEEEFNPRYDSPRRKAYIGIAIASIISTVSTALVSPTDLDDAEKTERTVGMTLAVISVVQSGMFAALHYLPTGEFLFTKNGTHAEGILLAFLSLMWMCVAGYTTRMGGIAHRSVNIYFSSWTATILSCKTFHDWSVTCGILPSMFVLSEGGELDSSALCKEKGKTNSTKLSSCASWSTIYQPYRTISGWILLFFLSILEVFSATDIHKLIDHESSSLSPKSKWAVSAGAISLALSACTLTCAYLLQSESKTASQSINSRPSKSIIGGYSELVLACFSIIWWTCAVAVLNHSDLIQTTTSLGPRGTLIVNGNQYTCFDGQGQVYDSTTQDVFVPVSNMYFAVWASFITSCWIGISWRKLTDSSDNKRIEYEEKEDEQSSGECYEGTIKSKDGQDVIDENLIYGDDDTCIDTI